MLKMSETQKIDDGGSAFPFGDYQNGGEPGMRLRDYFAAAALTGLIAKDGHNIYPWGGAGAQLAAKESYIVADAMIAARKEAQP
jgi:hypothetical protein